MAKVFIQEETLTAIGDAIREKTSTTAKLNPTVMPSYIRNIVSGGGGGYEPTNAELQMTGDMTLAFANDKWNWIIENYGDRIYMNDCAPLTKMFQNSDALREIPFVVRYSNASNNHDVTFMFQDCMSLMELPAIAQWRPTKLSSVCKGCYMLREIPDSFVNAIDWASFEGMTATYNVSAGSMFAECKSLRKYPMGMIHFPNCTPNLSSHTYYELVNMCTCLDEITNIPVDKNAITSNVFSMSFYNAHRLKRITFAPYDGTVNWKNQNIDLMYSVGYCSGNISDRITGYNSGITADKQVTDDATYQALKDDPDWFTKSSAYSRFNHDSAVELINSLPTTTGTGCTISFEALSGSKTDGGAINTLTEAEIAVAAAKGWTVSM